MKLENKSTQQLVIDQQSIQFASQQMNGFFEHIVNMSKEGHIHQSFVQEQEVKLSKRVAGNNEILDKIENEVSRRLSRDYKGVSTIYDLKKHVKELEEEQEASAKRREQMVETAKSIQSDAQIVGEDEKSPIKMNVSREKKV